MSRDDPAPALIVTRRSWLAASLAGLGWGLARASDDEEEGRHVEAVRARAAELGLRPMEVGRTEHYLAVGDAPARFRDAALEICEGLARDYLRHFQERKLDVRRPAGRLVVVVLSDPAAFAAFAGVDPSTPVRGVYDLDTNRLIACDNRGEANPLAERANTVALVHEATHQLTFNTGLLDRAGDVPLCISEGLATYGEVRRPRGQVRIGAENRERLAVLASAARAGRSLLPLAELIVRDEILDDPDTQQLAYGQSWLLTYHLLRTPALRDRYRAYLEAIRPRTAPDHRLDDARACLGDLGALDGELARAANRLIRR